MKSLSREDAIECMNDFGARRLPFLFIIDFLAKAPLVLPLNEIDKTHLLYDVQGNANWNAGDGSLSAGQTILMKHPISYKRYAAAFENVAHHIHEGNSYLLNLTFPTRIHTNRTLREIFFLSSAKYKLWMENQFVVFSPEPFIRIQNQEISSYPMKGTIDASIDRAQEIILNDEKELAEHTTIVDLIRNDLSMIASDVQVDSFRYIERISTNQKDLLQVSSKISGVLPPNYHAQIGTLLFTLLPAGSISGAPKKKTLEIILESEQYHRGYYTGVFGIFNGTAMESGVMIRFIENVDGALYYKSGGGITAMSTPESEYQEMIDKVYVPIV